jgi:hypothetical protein
MAFPPDPDEGQPGLVLLPDGRYGYQYPDSDDVIILKRAEAEETQEA